MFAQLFCLLPLLAAATAAPTGGTPAPEIIVNLPPGSALDGVSTQFLDVPRKFGIDVPIKDGKATFPGLVDIVNKPGTKDGKTSLVAFKVNVPGSRPAECTFRRAGPASGTQLPGPQTRTATYSLTKDYMDSLPIPAAGMMLKDRLKTLKGDSDEVELTCALVLSAQDIAKLTPVLPVLP